MRRTYSQDFASNGLMLRATVLEFPTIDDVVVTEAQITAYGIASQTPQSDRRVDREIRDFLVRFGVAR
jgi:SRSO17 transposase